MHMKIILTTTLLVLTGIGESSATILADWTFETSQPTTSGSFAAETGLFSSTSLASGSHAGSASYSSPAGARSSHSFNANTWASGDYFQFTTSTLGYEDIGVSFKATSSSTGPKDFQLAYSTDGSAFNNFDAYVVAVNGSPNTSWSSGMSAAAAAVYLVTFDLSSISGLNDQGLVYLRLINDGTNSEKGGTVAGSGTSRVDDFIITASPRTTATVPEPSTVFAGALLGLPVILTGLRRICQRLQDDCGRRC